MKKYFLIFVVLFAANFLFLACGNNEKSQKPAISTTNAAASNREFANNESADKKSARMYGIGSVSKIFTAAAVMKLADLGKLDLDTPLTTYISDFAMADRRYAMITPRMLLNHSSGFMGSTGSNAMLLGDNDTYYHDHFLDNLKSQTLKHDPGDRSIYSNDSFILAEILVERVSGESFTGFIERHFLSPLGLKNIKTPRSDFDRAQLANIYSGSKELLPENGNIIGTGGIYATMEDLCGFAAIFMNSADGSVLSKKSVNEMSKNQHKMELVPPGSDTILRYGLGWDAVDTYPFNQYGIKALSKGGDTVMYHTNLTVLPDYNLAAAVSASGAASHSQLVAQEIILAVLREEGLIPEEAASANSALSVDGALAMPKQNQRRAKIPESLLSYAGIYDAGIFGWWSVEFAESMILTPIGKRNERPYKYIYNTDGEFVSTNGDYIGRMPGSENANGISTITFAGNRYLLAQTYQDFPGLSQNALALPFAEKLEPNPVPASAIAAWKARGGREYLLVNEKHTSIQYFTALAKIHADDRVPGYITGGIYRAGESGVSLNGARIIDGFTALGFQNIPTMTGRDINNISVAARNGVEYLIVNEVRYIDSAAAWKFSKLDGRVMVETETVWVDIDGSSGGRAISIETPQGDRRHSGSWFVYDSKMNCIATSLEKNPRGAVTLPENGRIAFAGEAGTEFVWRQEREPLTGK